MNEYLKKVEEFQKAFKQNVETAPTASNLEIGELRYKLMKEENEEYLEAIKNGDIVEVADALADQLYILCGTILSHGLQDYIEPLFFQVHYSNMSKLDENGNPIINGENGVYDETRPLGKVLKSKNYFSPNLEQILNNK